MNFIAVRGYTSPVTLTLPNPNIPTTNNYIIADEGGNASTYNITIQGVTGTISGASQMVLNQNYSNVWIYSVPNSLQYFVLFTRP